MTYDLPPELEVEIDGPIRIVRLNRPDDLNATNHVLHQALADVFPMLDADEDARVAVITGNGRAFSAGGDFNYIDELTTDDALRRQTLIDGKRIVTGMVGCRIPVVAAVNGPAVGLGCSIVALSDIVYMSEKAHLADPHVMVGLVVNNILQHRTVSQRVKNLRLRLASQINCFGIATAFDIEHTFVRPTMFVIAD